MTQTITIQDFFIDTADWDNHSDAETANDAMGDWLSSISPSNLEELHSILVADADNDFEQRNSPTKPIMLKMIEAENRAFKKATKGYSEHGLRHISGHNCSIDFAADV